MDDQPKDYELSDEDLRAALREIKAYVDITEEDLRKIYAIALKHAKERIAAKVPVRDIMTKDVIAVKKDADIHEVAKLISDNRISGLPVVDEENRVIGIITEADILHMAGMDKEHTFRDILKRLLGEPFPKHKRGGKTGDIMTSPAITTTAETDIRKVAGVLDEKRIKRLPVVDDNNKLIGVISRGDIVGAIGK